MANVHVLGIIAGNWWMLALRGLAAVLFAIAAFAWPGLTLFALVILFGAFALVDGIVTSVAALRSRWWGLLVVGLVGIAAGVATLFWPGVTALALLGVIAAWSIVRGIFEIVAAIRLRKEMTNERLLILSGVISIAFGALIALFPGAGALSVVWVIGAYSLIVGVLLLVLAFRLRGAARHLKPLAM